MVRAVLALDMRAWGCAVCAVASEQAAIARLRLRGADPPPPPARSRAVRFAVTSLAAPALNRVLVRR